MHILLVSSPVAPLGDGRTGGVTLELENLAKAGQGHGITVDAMGPRGSRSFASIHQLIEVDGALQPSLAAEEIINGYPIPPDSVLAAMWQEAARQQRHYDVIVNLAQDWLPFYLTDFFDTPLLHIVNMGNTEPSTSVEIIRVANANPTRVRFISHSQTTQFEGLRNPPVMHLGLDIDLYTYTDDIHGGLVWAGRISPEKGLEDALEIAKRAGTRLAIAGAIGRPAYWQSLCDAYGAQIDYKGFLDTNGLQNLLGQGRALLQTQKWREAFGLVTIEAMACGTPVIAYDRGANGELIEDGKTGFLVTPDSIDEAVIALGKIDQIERKACRAHVAKRFSIDALGQRFIAWLEEVHAAHSASSS